MIENRNYIKKNQIYKEVNSQLEKDTFNNKVILNLAEWNFIVEIMESKTDFKANERMFALYDPDEASMYIMTLGEVFAHLYKKDKIADPLSYRTFIEGDTIKAYHYTVDTYLNGDVPNFLGEMSLNEFFDDLEEEDYFIKEISEYKGR
ncbi:hypothetical protein AB1K91_05180 [Terribacillus sp. 179-K 1B1 HS]|uniref:hypothetical protein n=1 Tax=Terribacillus sp. 179-K 1B1 HS TaxID=3142388 RepID=UPI0039A26631